MNGRTKSNADSLGEFGQLKASTLQEAVYQVLREAIAHRELKTGSVRLKDLAARLNVSTMPVREALRRLEGDGLARFDRTRGVIISELTVEDLHEVFALRRSLEPQAAQLAAQRATEAELAELRVLTNRMVATTGLGEWRDLNRTFHRQLYGLANAPRLFRLVTNLMDAAEPYRYLFVQSADGVVQSNAEHERLLEAAAARDIASLTTCLREHLDNSERVLLTGTQQWMAEREKSAAPALPLSV